MATSRKSRPKTVVECDAELEKIRTHENNKEKITQQEASAIVEQEKLLRETTATVSPEEELQRLTSLGNSINRSLALVSQQVRDEIHNLHELRSAVELEKRTLEDLYGKSVVASSISNLIAQYDEKKKELDIQIAERTKEWDHAREEYELEQAEYIHKRDQSREREEETYEYERAKKQQEVEDTWQEDRRVKERATALKQEMLEKQWAEREAKVRAAETELTALRNEAMLAPAKLEAVIKKAVAESNALLTKDYEHRISLDKSRYEAEVQLHNAKTSSLTEQVKALSETVAMLQTKLAISEEKVAQIANKALESASGSRTLAEVTSMIKERDIPNNRSKA